jgi:2,3-bisphosphoglycerate-dependent phosphoglycerate mutase
MQKRQVVFLRHAQSEWNVANRFTGWADVGLTPAGEAEARAAGRRLAAAGLSFDEAHASLLARTHRTLDMVLEEMGLSAIPRHYFWPLNERHYGALQGLDKHEIARRHGEAQFQRWRRGYRDTPPPLAHDDARHPRFDRRYAHIAPHHLPGGESLQDTRRRVARYWTHKLVPQVRAGTRVIVASHGNTLRALMMELQGLSEAEVERLEIPTGTPLVCEFDATMRLLDLTPLQPESNSKAA